jgi:hypothetical protein
LLQGHLLDSAVDGLHSTKAGGWILSRGMQTNPDILP